jgi:hypothetical protein
MAGKLRRKLIAVGVAVPLAAIALIGVAHTRFGRPLLSLLPGKSGCPVSLANASPAEFDHQRQSSMRALRGADPAPSRAAFGFALGRSTKADVAAWAAANGVSCKGELGGAASRCSVVPGAAYGAPSDAPPIHDLYLRFDVSGTVVAADGMHAGTSALAASAYAHDMTARLARDLGSPARTDGEDDASYLASGPYASYTIVYRFRDYAVDVSATNFDGALVVREQYRAID